MGHDNKYKCEGNIKIIQEMLNDDINNYWDKTTNYLFRR